MDYLRIITNKNKTASTEEGTIAIDTSNSENPILEYKEGENWIPIDNLNSNKRMSKMDDLYSFLHKMDWGIGPRLYTDSYNSLWMSTKIQDNPITTLKTIDGINLSESVMTEDKEKIDKINTEEDINVYSDYLLSARDLVSGFSVVDLWEYPTEYGSILNLCSLPNKIGNLKYSESPSMIKLCVAWTKNTVRKTKDVTFVPWKVNSYDGTKFEWKNFISSLDNEITVEFYDGCIRLFPESSEITECIIHHCFAVYDKLL